MATAKMKPSLLLKGGNPRLIDDWQEAPVLWGAIRMAVDDRQKEGLFILTGSTSVDEKQIHHTEQQVPLREPDLLIVITGGNMAFTRDDGVKIIPIACLKD